MDKDDDTVTGTSRNKDEVKILTEARERYKLAVEAEQENREKAADDISFAAGNQWPEDVLAEREQNGRPALVINRIPQFVRQIINDIRQNRPAIKVAGVDDKADPYTAEVLTGLIKNIEVTSDAEVAYDTAVEYAIRGGFGAFRVSTDYVDDMSFDKEIKIERIRNPLSVHFDPNAQCPVKSDAKWAFISDWLRKEDAEEQYGEGVSSWEGDGVDDDERELWLDEDNVRIVEYWKVEEEPVTFVQLTNGAVMPAAEFAKQEQMLALAGIGEHGRRKGTKRKVVQRVLSAHKVHETTEWAGYYIPLVFVPGEEVIVEGKTTYSGIVRHMADAQRMYNYWRTAATEKLALEPKAPWLIAEGQIEGYEREWDEANTRNLSRLTYKNIGAPPPQRQVFNANSGALLEQSMIAADDLKAITGIYDASLGARSNETSGVAINARQREGDNATFHFTDNLVRAIRQCGRILVDLIPKIYDQARVVRILNPDGSDELAAINSIFPAPGQKQVADVRLGRYDVTVDAGPSFATQRQEAAASMIEMVRANPQLMPIMGDLLVKNLDWPGADEMAKRLRAMLPPQVAAIVNAEEEIPPAAQQQIQQAQQAAEGMSQQMQGMQAELAKLQGIVNSKQQDLQMKQADAAASVETAQIERELKMAEMELEREKLQVERQRLQLEADKLAREQMEASMNNAVLRDEHGSQLAAISQQIAGITAAVEALGGEMARRASVSFVKDASGRITGTVDAEGNPLQVIERDESGRAVAAKPATLQ